MAKPKDVKAISKRPRFIRFFMSMLTTSLVLT